MAVVNVLPRPEVILTHESDLDGLVAGLLLQRLARHLFGQDVRLEAYHYNNWRLREPREKSGWICDLTSRRAWTNRTGWSLIIMPRNSKPVTPCFIHDVAKSAGLLCYQLCQERGLGSPELTAWRA